LIIEVGFNEDPIITSPYQCWHLFVISAALLLHIHVLVLIAGGDSFGAHDCHRLWGWRPGPFELIISCLPKEP